MTTAPGGRFWLLQPNIVLVMLANGMQGTLLGLRATEAGFGAVVTGVVMAGYSVGFLASSPVTARVLPRLGHVNMIRALIILMAATAPLQGALVHPVPWMLLRFVQGCCMCAAYITWEAWINGRATTANRGRLAALYTVSMMSGFAFGPLLTGIAPVTNYALFLLPAALLMAALVPLSGAGGSVPAPVTPHPLSLRALARLVPAGVVGGLVVGMTHSALTMMGAVYAKRVGLDDDAAARFVFACYIGSVAFQFPIGWAYDHLGKRATIIGCCLATAASAGAAMVLPPTGAVAFATVFVVGALCFPLYGLVLAYMNEWVPDGARPSVSAGYALVGGIGAIVGPVAVSLLMKGLGAGGYWWLQIMGTTVLATFIAGGAVRRRRPSAGPVGVTA